MNMLVSGAALLLACTAFVTYDLVTFRESMVRSLSVQAQIIGSNSVSALLFKDPQAAESTLSALKVAPNILSAGIYTPDSRLFATHSRDGSSQAVPLPSIPAGQTEVHWFKDRQIVLFRSIEFQGKTAGTVYILSDLQEMSDRLKRYAGIVAAVLLTSLLAALLVSSISRRAIAEPIVCLAETARIVSREKNYSVRTPPTGNQDEVGILIEAFNEMLAEIQERDGALLKAHDELEQRVQERTAALEEVNKELEAFTYSVSHDLRAPLRHIDGFSRILMEDHGAHLTVEAQRLLGRIRDGARQMGCLVDDLLNLSRLGRREIVTVVTSLEALLKEVLAELKPTLGNREIEFQIAALPFVSCDAGLMKQVFANLLSNAVKYTRPRERAVIEVGQILQDGHEVVYVRDNGVGFNMKYADKLFGVFQRLHRQEDFEGTGVGLATIHRIIHKHSGRVWAESQLDKGATFYFTLGDKGLLKNEKIVRITGDEIHGNPAGGR